MKSSVLGYGGAILLVAVALAILADALMGGGTAATPPAPAAVSGSPAVTGPLVPVTPSAGPAGGGPAGGGGPVAVPSPPAPRGTPQAGGTGPCPARSARYQRSGDTVRVSVHFPGSGYVAAFVEATGQEPMTKSATNTGRPQTFEFTGVPAATTERIGVTVITGAGLRTCEVQQRR